VFDSLYDHGQANYIKRIGKFKDEQN